MLAGLPQETKHLPLACGLIPVGLCYGPVIPESSGSETGCFDAHLNGISEEVHRDEAAAGRQHRHGNQETIMRGKFPFPYCVFT